MFPSAFGRLAARAPEWGRGRSGAVTLLAGAFVVAHLLFLTFRWGGEELLALVNNIASIPVALGTAAVLWAASRGPSLGPRTRRAWRLYALAFIVYAVGNAQWCVWEQLWGPPSFPSVPYIPFLLVYPLMTGALLSFSDALEGREEKLTFGLDAGTMVIAAGMYFWHFLCRPILLAGRADLMTTVGVLAFPVCDVLLLFGVTSLILRHSRQASGRVVGLQLASVLLILGGNTLFLYRGFFDNNTAGSLPDAMWSVGYFLALLSGQYQCRHTAADAAPRAARERKGPGFLPYAAVALGYGLLLGVPNADRPPLIYGALVLIAIVVVRQVVATRSAERAMVAARDAALESTRLKSEFLANMSHEIRTPMNGVIGMTNIMLGTELAPEQREHLEMVKSSADSLLTVINDILDFSKIEAGKLELDAAPFGLRQAVGDATAALAVRARQKGLALTCEVAPDVPDGLRGDAGRLQQVITNLVGNAVKFTDSGGVAVSVGVEAAAGRDVRLRFAVADTGCGIAPGKQHLIFDAFTQEDSSTTRRYGGTGLGLAICAQLVALMGGRIWVEPEPGRGSAFVFTVAFELAEEVSALAEPPAARSQEPLRVLLAEDNRINQLVATKMLQRGGHTVTVVGDGREAVEALERERFDVVLMDVQMPEMDGFEATALIRERERSTGEHVPIVALTAHAMKGDEERCLAAGMDGYVTKPVQARELLDALEQAVRAYERV